MFTANDVKELREKTGAGMLDCKKALDETKGNIEEAITWLREKGISKAAKKSERIAAEGLCDVSCNDNVDVIFEVNSETDFVAKNEEFKNLITTIREALLNNDVATMEEALQINVNGETLNDIIVNLTAKIGEKLSFRRFEIVKKSDAEVFGNYIHMGGKIVSLVVLEGTNQEVAKDVAMHVAAMNPKYIYETEATEEELETERKIAKEQAINEGKPADIAEKMVEGKVKKYLKEISLVDQPFVKDSSITVGQYVSNNNMKITKMIRYEVGEGMEKRNENFAEEVQNQING